MPSADVLDDGQSYRVLIETPGVAKEDVEVRPGPVAGTLVVRAQTRVQSQSSATPLRMERGSLHSPIRYERVVPVAWDADTAAAKASLQEGLLTLTVPKRSPTRVDEMKK